jgi:hypothetical protein
MSIRRVLLMTALVASATGTLRAEPAPSGPQTQAAPSAPAATAAAASASAEPEGGPPRFWKAETAAERLARIDLGGEDPGPNPDPQKVWTRRGHKVTIQRFERRWAKFDAQPGFVRPLAMVNFADELYQENDKYVWVWMEEAAPIEEEEERAAAAAQSRFFDIKEEGIAYLDKIRDDFSPLDPPQAGVTIRFENSSAGLPTGGSWRNSLAVGDMNEDGFPDLITTAQRSPGSNTPSIFLGNGKGGWQVW